MFQLEKFGARLLLLRKERKLSQEKIAALLGVTRTQVSDMERGKSATSLERLVALSEFYGVSTDYLLGLRDNRG